MGLLIDGVWSDRWYDTQKSDGKFIRQESKFRHWITADGSSGFKAEAGRYHLYVSYACPWAHRTLIFRALKGLETIISVSVVHWFMGEYGWTFAEGEGVIPDPVAGVQFLHEIYTKVEPSFTGRVTVPILFDKQTNTIVNNESSEIIRMFNSAFDNLGAVAGDYYPEELRSEIDRLNERIYHTVNNGVYKSGFATTQQAYEEAVYPLFATLDYLEELLSTRRYLTGDRVTEADWRLFVTLLRFDLVYVAHFKCSHKRIAEYPNLWAYTRELYQMSKIATTVNFKHIKDHYYQSLESINPNRIVPIGSQLNFDAAHHRGS